MTTASNGPRALAATEAAGDTGAVRRLRALGRAELTLLLRNRTALFTALFIPVGLTVATRGVVADLDLESQGLSLGEIMLPGAIGFVLLFAVYSNLVGTYVVRREELVLKRLRTGEARDGEILAGAALPSLVLGLAQCVLLVAGGAALLELAPPEAPELLVLGLLLGLALTAVAAAATAAFTSTAEAAQLTPMPLMLVSFTLSGVLVPLEALPDQVATVAGFLPLTPVMELLRGAWSGDVSDGDTPQAVAVCQAWTVLAVWTVRDRFRWEPRR
jgi:ABC-2 type transport system permease protein